MWIRKKERKKERKKRKYIPPKISDLNIRGEVYGQTCTSGLDAETCSGGSVVGGINP